VNECSVFAARRVFTVCRMFTECRVLNMGTGGHVCAGHTG